MKDFLNTEISHKAIVGPYTATPLSQLQCSPMLTRPKATTNKRRIIVDLSWPRGLSVNDCVSSSLYLGTEFVLKFPTIDDITSRIIQLQGNVYYIK